MLSAAAHETADDREGAYIRLATLIIGLAKLVRLASWCRLASWQSSDKLEGVAEAHTASRAHIHLGGAYINIDMSSRGFDLRFRGGVDHRPRASFGIPRLIQDCTDAVIHRP